MNYNELRNKEEYSRVGVKWLKEEDLQLEEEIKEKKSYEDIALEHKRTITGIKSRIITEILYPKYKNENISLEELSEEYNIDKNIIEKYINKKQITKSIEKNKEEIIDKNEYIINEIQSLKKKFNSIENKLNKIIYLILV